MIQSGSFVNVIDNSGAKKGFCIKLLKSGYNQKYAHLGCLLLISIKTIKSSKNARVKKGEMHRAILVRTKVLKGFSCSHNKYFDNAVVLLNKQNKPLGTRIFGSIPVLFKYSRYLKLTTLSYGLIH